MSTLLDNLVSPLRNPHTWYALSNRCLAHHRLQPVAEWSTRKGLAVNNVANLRALHHNRSDAEIRHQLQLEYGQLYCQYAWILWQKGQPEQAANALAKGIACKLNTSGLSAEDHLREGLIVYTLGNKDEGWRHIVKALLADMRVEDRNPDYRAAIEAVVRDQFPHVDPGHFVSQLRRQQANTFFDLALTNLDGTPFDAAQLENQVCFVNFFNPVCGSCRQQIAALSARHPFEPLNDVVWLFVLSQPDLQVGARRILRDLPWVQSVLLAGGSAYDQISVEPTVWLVDRHGRIAYRHEGYCQDDVHYYAAELADLCLAPH